MNQFMTQKVRAEYKHARPEILFAYQCLSIEQQIWIDRNVINITNQVKNVGPRSALELLFCLGRFLANPRRY